MLTILRIIIIFVLAGGLMAACNTWVPPTPPPPPPDLPEDMPPDFHVRSEYYGQAVSPVYHYDYFIVLDPSTADTISFHPDYMDSNPPVWVETFDAAEGDLENLWDLMVMEDIFREDWSLIADTMVGAWTRTLQITADDGYYNVPRWVQDTTSANSVYYRIDSLVPAAVWDSLWAWRELYISGDTTGHHP
jgi:hypothetical protein